MAGNAEKQNPSGQKVTSKSGRTLGFGMRDGRFSGPSGKSTKVVKPSSTMNNTPNGQRVV